MKGVRGVTGGKGVGGVRRRRGGRGLRRGAQATLQVGDSHAAGRDSVE